MATTTLEQRIVRVLDEIGAAAARAGRPEEDVTIVAVSKSVERDVVDAAYQAGLRHFGENRVQDAAVKFALPLPSDATLHMIGQLQTNKTGLATRLFQVIESVDRVSLIRELDKRAASLDARLPVLLQVNIAGEEQKSGCIPDQAAGLIDLIMHSERLDLQGFMTIAPLVSDPEDARPVFRGLRQLRDRMLRQFPGVSLDALSMGMSNDFLVAIGEGATHVRVGRAIFED